MSDTSVAETINIEQQTQDSTQRTVLGELPEQSFTGRGVFAVQTVDVGIAVSGAILTDDGRLLNAPAVFPDLGYALSQIDELRALVLKHFGEAAAIGVQVLAQASRASAQAASEQAKTGDAKVESPIAAVMEQAVIQEEKMSEGKMGVKAKK